MAHELTFEEIQECRKVFEIFKVSNESVEESKIKINDLHKILCALGFKVQNREIDDFCVSMDLESEIDFMTFLRVAAVKYKHKEFLINMKEAYKAFDKNEKGYLETNEIKSIITQFGPKISSEDADFILKELGLHNVSNFNYNDFIEKNI